MLDVVTMPAARCAGCEELLPERQKVPPRGRLLDPDVIKAGARTFCTRIGPIDTKQIVGGVACPYSLLLKSSVTGSRMLCPSARADSTANPLPLQAGVLRGLRP